jgi:hypothetical protein
MIQRQTDKLTISLFKIPDANKKGFFISSFFLILTQQKILIGCVTTFRNGTIQQEK